MLDATDDEIELAREELQKQGDVEALQEFDDEDNIYARVSFRFLLVFLKAHNA